MGGERERWEGESRGWEGGEKVLGVGGGGKKGGEGGREVGWREREGLKK